MPHLQHPRPFLHPCPFSVTRPCPARLLRHKFLFYVPHNWPITRHWERGQVPRPACFATGHHRARSRLGWLRSLRVHVPRVNFSRRLTSRPGTPVASTCKRTDFLFYTRSCEASCGAPLNRAGVTPQRCYACLGPRIATDRAPPPTGPTPGPVARRCFSCVRSGGRGAGPAPGVPSCSATTEDPRNLVKQLVVAQGKERGTGSPADPAATCLNPRIRCRSAGGEGWRAGADRPWAREILD